MINNIKTTRFNIINSLVIIALVFTLAITTIINTNSQAQEVPTITSEELVTESATESTIIPSELEWVEDDSQTFYPTEEDQILSEEEVKDLGLELKFNQQTSQDLNLEFKTDFKTQLNLKGGLTDTTTRQAELNIIADSINNDFQAELQSKREEEAKKYEEFNKLTHIYKTAESVYNDVSKKVDGILKTEDKGVSVVTDIVLDVLGLDNHTKGIAKMILNGSNTSSDYQKYQFDQDLDKIKNIFK
jgi:hypothetical protein